MADPPHRPDPPRYDELDLRDAGAVAGVFAAGTHANRTAACRRAAIDHVHAAPPERLIASGDLHDNPLNLARLVRAAALLDAPAGTPPAHLSLHEIIHGPGLVNDMDFSFRALARVAALKAAYPGHVHTLLANHELAQIVGAGVMKDGVNAVRAFEDAVEFTFGARAGEVSAAIGAFIRSMPLALRIDTPAGSILCAHSLPSPDLMDRFDPGVLGRELTEEDYTPRRGSAHLMVWGRDQTPENLAALGARWGVDLFILGHELAEEGVLALPPNAVILNSDHAHGAYLEIELSAAPALKEVPALVRRLADG